MATPYANELDGFKDSDVWFDSSRADILKNLEQRQYLQNRLIAAFEAGWTARDKYDGEIVPVK
jgi:hypothetical protein